METSREDLFGYSVRPPFERGRRGMAGEARTGRVHLTGESPAGFDQRPGCDQALA